MYVYMYIEWLVVKQLNKVIFQGTFFCKKINFINLIITTKKIVK